MCHWNLRDFVTIPMTMQGPCMAWMRQDAIQPPLNDVPGIVVYQIGSNPEHIIAVARAMLDQAKVSVKFNIARGYFS